MEKSQEYIIYKAENHLGEKYIGCCSVQLKQRKYHHEYYAANNPTSRLHHSIVKYGADKFDWLVIDTAETKTEAEIKERVYIDHYLSFYSLNGNRGGQGLSGRKHSDETKQKMREKKLGIPKSEQHKKNMSQSAMGKHSGELSGMAKLTEKEVREIRRLLNETKLTQQDIANFFHVSQSTIATIKTNRTWKHVV